MKKWSFLVGLTTVFLLAVTAGPSAAAHRPFAVTLTPLIGGYNFDSDQRLEDELAFGLALGYNFTERWGAEGTVRFVDTEFKDGQQQTADVYNLSLNVLYHFRPNRALVPFATAGLGAQTIRPNTGASDENLLFNYGFGVKYFLLEDIGLRAEVRHVLARNNLTGNSDVFSNLSYTVGLTFQFGGDRRELPKKPDWDTDGDGVPDKFDRCPGTPAGAQVDGLGCH